jgi:hypothetical protein
MVGSVNPGFCGCVEPVDYRFLCVLEQVVSDLLRDFDKYRALIRGEAGYSLL